MCALLCVVAGALALPRTAVASPRTWQPLVIGGAQIHQLLGARISYLEVVALRDGRPVPIPFQVDERLADGRYALPYGREPVLDDNPGVLDAADEIAMMLSDLGPRVTAADVLRPGAIEIAVADPLGGPPRYAYIAVVEFPRRSLDRYVEFENERNVIESDAYRIGFTNEMPTDFALQERKGENRPNMIDRFKIRVSARVLNYFNLSLDEGRLINRLVAWRAGPVRVIRRIDHAMRLVLGIRSPEVVSYNFFYRDYVQNPFEVRFPWIPRILFGDIKVRIALDFTDLSGFRLVWSDMEREPIDIRATRGIAILGESDTAPSIRWIGFSGRGRIVVQTLAPAPILERIDRRLFFRHDPELSDPPERVPGESPALGYVMTGWEDLPSGTHHLDSLLVVARDEYSPDLLLRELSVPPLVECRVMAADGASAGSGSPAR